MKHKVKEGCLYTFTHLLLIQTLVKVNGFQMS